MNRERLYTHLWVIFQTNRAIFGTLLEELSPEGYDDFVAHVEERIAEKGMTESEIFDLWFEIYFQYRDALAPVLARRREIAIREAEASLDRLHRQMQAEIRELEQAG